MVDLRFNGGDIEFYGSDKPEFDGKYLHSYTKKLLIFQDYSGKVGLSHDSSVSAYGKVNMQGHLFVPSYIITSGDANFSIPMNMRLTVRSTNKGKVNGEDLGPKVSWYGYGPTFEDYVREYLGTKIKKEGLEIRNDDIKSYGLIDKKKVSVENIEICRNYNLIYLYSRGFVNIDTRYTLDDIINADLKQLREMLTSFIEKEEYEQAAAVHKRIDDIINERKR